MEATQNNHEIAKAIINLFAENNCTIAQASDILRFTQTTIQQQAAVQKVTEKLFEIGD